MDDSKDKGTEPPEEGVDKVDPLLSGGSSPQDPVKRQSFRERISSQLEPSTPKPPSKERQRRKNRKQASTEPSLQPVTPDADLPAPHSFLPEIQTDTAEITEADTEDALRALQGHPEAPDVDPGLAESAPTGGSSSEGGRWVRVRQPWSRKRRYIVVSAAALAIVLIVGITAVVWLQRQIDPPGPEGVEVVLEIPEGASVNDIARILTNKDVVRNFTVARIWWRNAGPFVPGQYVFKENMSLSSARQVLNAGPEVNVQLVVLPEGLWLTEIESRILSTLPDFDALELDTALRGSKVRSVYQPEGVDSLEGLLFPDTYQVDDAGAKDEEALVQRLVDQFDSVLDDLGYQEALSRTGFSAYEVVTIASIVEAEATVPEDRGKIARVAYNRLAMGLKLEMDTTVNYAIGERKLELTVSELEIDSPYNTRRNLGLPPTPIAAPGRASLEAALNPEPGNWLYFVLATSEGGQFFTDDFQEFLNQVAKSRAEGLF